MASASVRAVVFWAKKDLVVVHQFGTTRVHHAGQVGDKDVLARNAQLDQQAQAGQRGSAGTGGHQLDLLRGLCRPP
jgi:hypothetical protein